MKTIVSVALAVLMAGAMGAAQAGDAAAGEAEARGCAGCHGKNGMAKNKKWPNLAGQNEGYLIHVMKQYRDGKRGSKTMQGPARKLSDEDIANLAAYYSGMK